MSKLYSLEDLEFLNPKSFNMCSYNTWLSSPDTKFIPKNSVSDTFQVLSKIRSKNIPEAIKNLSESPIFIKISDHTEIVKNGSSLMMEILLYRYMELLRNANVINFIPKYYMDFSCIFKDGDREVEDLLGVSNAKIDGLNRIAAKNFKSDRIHLLITEQYGENIKSLSRIFRDYSKGIQYAMEFVESLKGTISSEFPNLLYQIEYITNELAINGVRHNDLHSENFYIEIFDDPKPLIFYERNIVTGDATRIELLTRYKAHIIDFDKGAFVGNLKVVNEDVFSSKKNGFPSIENDCKEYGTCDYPMEVFDLNIILSYLYNYLIKIPELKKNVQTFVRYLRYKYPNKEYSKYFVQNKDYNKFMGRLCQNKYDCDDPLWDPTEKNPGAYIVSHQQILSNLQEVLPNLRSVTINPPVSQINNDFLANGASRVCISSSIQSPFQNTLDELAVLIKTKYLEQANYVNISYTKLQIREDIIIKNIKSATDLVIIEKGSIGSIENFVRTIEKYLEELKNPKFVKVRNRNMGLLNVFERNYSKNLPSGYFEQARKRIGF